MRAQFSPAVIGELRHRVIAHNEALGKDEGRVKLGELKHLYKRWFGGRDPHHHALNKIDKHLTSLRARLVKAEEPFNGQAHPRGQHGRFRPDGGPSRGEAHGGGSGGSGGGGGPMPPASEPTRPLSPPYRPMTRNGEDASVVQVIPETRYSTFGPPVAGLAGVAYGAYSGADAKLGGTPIDRAITRGTTWGGRKLGTMAGRSAAGVKHVGAMGARAGIGAINRTLHTSYARPGPLHGLDPVSVERLAARGAKIGGAAGRVLGTAQALPGIALSAPSVGLRRGFERAWPGPKGRITGRVAGGVFGAATTGALVAAPVFANAMSQIGPYLDAAFPRRVHKMLGDLWDAPEVLAKQAELTANDGLAKASVGPALRYIASRSRNLVMRGAQAFRTLTPGVSNHTVGPTAVPIPDTIGGRAGRQAFQSAGKEGPFQARDAKQRPIRGAFEASRGRAGRAIDVGTHVATLGAGGAAVGAIGGAAGAFGLNAFRPEQHPRDDHGRFARKDIAVHQAAKTGAKIGGAIGLGAGLLAGISAARHGHSEVLRAAIKRLTEAAPEMTEAAEKEARTVHARTFAEDRRNAARMRPFAPGEAISHDRVQASLEGHAANAFSVSRRGKAMQGAPQGWYHHQIEEAFDARAKQLLPAIPNAKPLLGHDGKPLSANAVNLIDNLDPSKLNPRQRRAWDQLVQQRTNVHTAVETAYEKRLGDSAKLGEDIKAKEAERAALDKDLGGEMMAGARALEEADAPAAAIKRFAKQRLKLPGQPDVELKGTDKAQLHADLKDAIDKWHDGASTRVDELERDIETAKKELEDKRQQTGGDLSDEERQQIRNPFTTDRNKQYFEPRPSFANEKARVQANASREFLRQNNLAATEAKDIAGALVTQRRQSLEAGIPETGFIGKQFEQHAPRFAADLRQAVQDYRAIATARRENAHGAAKWIYDQVHANKDPKRAWESASKMADWIQKHGKSVSDWAFRHWKPIFTTVSLGSAFGVVDLSQPAGGKTFKHPRHWRRPPTMAPVIEFPDPINKPNEAVLGFAYQDRHTKQQRFLHGVHIYDKKGSHNSIPFGSSVEQVRNQVRNRGGGAGGGGRVNAMRLELSNDDRQRIEKTLNQLRQQNQISNRNGWEDSRFNARTGGQTNGDDRKVFDAIAAQTVRKYDSLNGRTPNNRQTYYQALKTVFDGHGAHLLDLGQKAALLIGGHGLPRGIFGSDSAYSQNRNQADKDKVVAALKRQITAQGHSPSEQDEYRTLAQAMWTVANHYGLSEPQRQDLRSTLSQAFTRNSGRVPQSGPESQAGGSRSRIDQFANDMLEEIPKQERVDEYNTDEEFADATRDVYRQAWTRVQQREAEKEPSEQLGQSEMHDEAVREARRQVRGALRKLAPEGGLRKFLVYGQSRQSRTPRVPKLASGTGGEAPVRTVPTTAPIKSPATGGLGAPAETSNPPAIAGSGRPGTRPNLATRLGASHQIGQAGSYGLSTAAYEGLEGLSEAIPEMRAASTLGRVALGIGRVGSSGVGRMAGSAGANAYGTTEGRQLGRDLGDTGNTGAPRSEREGDVRLMGGMMGGIAGQHAGKTIGRVGLRNAPGALAQDVRGLPKSAASFARGVPGKISGAARSVAGLPGRAAQGVRNLGGRMFGSGAKAAATSAGEGIAGSAARAAGTGTLEALGSRIGGTVGGVGGTVAGEVADPAGGGVAGHWAGHALGAAIGAGAGWLADEGIGMLYRHLGHSYGPAVAHTAAASLGVPRGMRQRHGAAISGAAQR